MGIKCTFVCSCLEYKQLASKYIKLQCERHARLNDEIINSNVLQSIDFYIIVSNLNRVLMTNVISHSD